jgi:hypothetical protein
VTVQGRRAPDGTVQVSCTGIKCSSAPVVLLLVRLAVARRDDEQVGGYEGVVLAKGEEAGVKGRFRLAGLEDVAMVEIGVREDAVEASGDGRKVLERRRRDAESVRDNFTGVFSDGQGLAHREGK